MYDMKNLKKMERFGELAPDAFKAFAAFDEAAFRGEAIPLKYKQLSTRKGRGNPARTTRSWPRRRWSRRRCVPVAP